MPKTKSQKGVELKAYTSMLENAEVAVVAEFSGLTMVNLDAIRAESKEKGVSFRVVKNTLLNLAFEEAGATGVNFKKLGKMLALLAGGPDAVTAPKLASKFAKDNTDKLQIFAGIYEGKGVGADIIKQLASIPSREELLAKVVGSMNAPVSGFVQVLGGNVRQFAYVINAIKEKKS
jgi:large subunit ribosomal protein L10